VCVVSLLPSDSSGPVYGWWMGPHLPVCLLFSLVARVLQLTTTKCCVGGSVDVEGLFLGSVLNVTSCFWITGAAWIRLQHGSGCMSRAAAVTAATGRHRWTGSQQHADEELTANQHTHKAVSRLQHPKISSHLVNQTA
jgi:hypothetical protein